MTYRQLKWLIIIIPSLTIGMWEFVRHRYLLSVISMELGNWLSPFITLAVSLLFLTRLFDMIERAHRALEKEKATKAVAEERERIAREIHDRVAQSLFFLHVKAQKIREKTQKNEAVEEDIDKMIHSLRKTHSDVRQAIRSLKQPAEDISHLWHETITRMIRQFADESQLEVTMDIGEEHSLTSREKVELISCLNELLVNIQKHASATRVHVEYKETGKGWFLRVSDNGAGIGDLDQLRDKGYGIGMMEERLQPIGARLIFYKNNENGRGTVAEIRKERG